MGPKGKKTSNRASSGKAGGKREEIGNRGNNEITTASGSKHQSASKKTTNSNRKPGSSSNKGNSKQRKEYTKGNAHHREKYPKYWDISDCLDLYHKKDPTLIRGKLRVLPTTDGAAFCTCDRGSLTKDVLIESPLERNRALDGDVVFVEILPLDEEMEAQLLDDNVQDAEPDDAGDGIQETWWQDDSVQMDLWNPTVPTLRKQGTLSKATEEHGRDTVQRRGRVVFVIPPKRFGSEINPAQKGASKVTRRIVGTLKRLQSGTTLLTSSNKSLVQFRLSDTDAQKYRDSSDGTIFVAQYAYGSWKPEHKWPPCQNLEALGRSCNIEDETTALLIENDVDHGEFPADVLKESQEAVAEGEYQNGEESGWRPTPDMYKGRRDFRRERIFTIDPTTAKDLDDALHIKILDNGQIELGVHIADVSHFVQPNSKIDLEAQRRCTTVYLVDRVIPMLPRALCEIACSLNEDVERLAFSCVWRMNKDGSLAKGHEVWYGRSVIKSCARLDYATAQNIIDRVVATGEKEVDESLWPKSRLPSGEHTIDQVAADVRLMHEVGMNRRRLRFLNGAVALNAVKLTFELDSDGQTPMLCKPYPIRDSNRLVEEFMLLANYLVSQRLITHAKNRALLRNHEPPLYEGLEKVASMAQESIGFNIEIGSSQQLQKSLNRLNRECHDELVMKCITEMLKLPMKPAKYVVTDGLPSDEWSHFALNIPYYTHFTSPIRRYADVIVHRILHATIVGFGKVPKDYLVNVSAMKNICECCNEKKEGSRKAQDRSDTVFLSLYLKHKPMRAQLGVVLSVGQKTFTVFVPSLGISSILFIDEHKTWISVQSVEEFSPGNRKITLERIAPHEREVWQKLVIRNFTRIRVSCLCRETAPINVKLVLEGPWER